MISGFYSSLYVGPWLVFLVGPMCVLLNRGDGWQKSSDLWFSRGELHDGLKENKERCGWKFFMWLKSKGMLVEKYEAWTAACLAACAGALTTACAAARTAATSSGSYRCLYRGSYRGQCCCSYRGLCRSFCRCLYRACSAACTAAQSSCDSYRSQEIQLSSDLAF